MKAFKQSIRVGEHKIGENGKVFIIAEIGINHQGSVETAKKMIDVIAAAGADAVKFQAFKADEFVADKEQTYTYESQGTAVTEPMYDMFKRYEFSQDDFQELFDYCKKKNIFCFATPQNISDMRMLRSLGVKLLKVGSDDLTNLPLLRAYALTKLPVIISTGMADLSDIQDAVKVFRESGNDKLMILHCISSYPAEAQELNLLRINTIRDTFKVITGFSDHSNGMYAAIASVALGAKIIEKHVTLDKNMPGPDHRFSANPEDLAALVKGVRYVEAAIGSPVIKPTAADKKMRILARRSIVAARDIPKGEKITVGMIEYKRPGSGLLPKYTPRVVGKRAKRAILKGQLVTLANIS